MSYRVIYTHDTLFDLRDKAIHVLLCHHHIARQVYIMGHIIGKIINYLFIISYSLLQNRLLSLNEGNLLIMPTHTTLHLRRTLHQLHHTTR